MELVSKSCDYVVRDNRYLGVAVSQIDMESLDLKNLNEMSSGGYSWKN